jgi:hypothetical protein
LPLVAPVSLHARALPGCSAGGPISCLLAVQVLLFKTPEATFVQLQLKGAVRQEDPGRIVFVTMKLKVWISPSSSLHRFSSLSNCALALSVFAKTMGKKFLD